MQGAHSTFAIGGVQCSADTFFVNHNFVLRINISGKIPPIANLQNVMANCNRTVKRCTGLKRNWLLIV